MPSKPTWVVKQYSAKGKLYDTEQSSDPEDIVEFIGMRNSYNNRGQDIYDIVADMKKKETKTFTRGYDGTYFKVRRIAGLSGIGKNSRRCKYGKVKSGPRKGLCRLRPVKRRKRR